jgi:hypothetical protein
LSREGSEAKVTLSFKDKQGSHEGTMTMLSVGMFQQLLTNISCSSSKVHFEQENLAAVSMVKFEQTPLMGACKSLGWPVRSICSDPRMSLCHTARKRFVSETGAFLSRER